MAEGNLPQPQPVGVRNADYAEIFTANNYNILVVRANYDGDNFIQAIFNGPAKTITFAKKLSGESETTVFTVQGS